MLIVSIFLLFIQFCSSAIRILPIFLVFFVKNETNLQFFALMAMEAEVWKLFFHANGELVGASEICWKGGALGGLNKRWRSLKQQLQAKKCNQTVFNLKAAIVKLLSYS